MNAGKVQSIRGRRQRGASPLVGIVLLFALVMIGATLVFVAGSAMFDALQSEATNERTQQVMLETDHRISTVATTGYDQPLPTDELQGAQVIDDGSISVAWYNNSTRSDPWTDSSCTVSGDLGALEIEDGSSTIVHQGGGIWERTDGGTTVLSEPNIGYDGGELQLQILQLDEGDIGGSGTIARSNHSRATALTEEIKETAASCPDGTNVAFRITSSYHGGWNQYLDSEFDGNASVNHDPATENVTVKIEDVRKPFDPAMFIVAEDHGLRGPGGKELQYEQRLARSLAGSDGDNSGNRGNNGNGGNGGGGTNAVFSIKTTIENTGERKDSQNISVEIWDKNLSNKLIETRHSNLTIDEKRTETIGHPELKFELDKSQKQKLSPGNNYKYLIKTEDDTTDTPGSFYIGTSNPYFEISNASHGIDENVTITAEVQNLGIENTSDQSVELELDYLDDKTPTAYENIEANTVDGTYGATTTVTWTINKSRMLYGSHSYRIDTGDEKTDPKTFTVETGVDPGETKLHLDPGNQVNVSVLGTEVSAERPTGETKARFVNGDKGEGEWRRSDGGEWHVNIDYEQWDASGGWRTNYNRDRIWWDDSGGWELEQTKRYGGWTWEGSGEWVESDVYQKQWAPVTAEIITQPVNESGEPTGNQNTIQPDSWGSSDYNRVGTPESQNLNTHDTRDRIWRYNFTTQERVSLTLSSTLHTCRDYDREYTDMYTDGEIYEYHDTWSEDDGNGYWEHYDCTDIGGEFLNVDATTDSNNANVRVRDSKNNIVPELRAGHQRQRSADEVLERSERDLFGGKSDNGTGYLDLEEGKEFVFMFELTDEAPDSADPDEYWKQAKETSTPGDPNFNDMIVLVEVDKMPTAEIAAPVPVNGNEEQIDVGKGNSESDASDHTGARNDPGIEVNTDHIIIG